MHAICIPLAAAPNMHPILAAPNMHAICIPIRRQLVELTSVIRTALAEVREGSKVWVWTRLPTT